MDSRHSFTILIYLLSGAKNPDNRVLLPAVPKRFDTSKDLSALPPSATVTVNSYFIPDANFRVPSQILRDFTRGD